MRHLWTLIAAVLIAPLAWLLLAYGQDRSLQAFVNEEAAGAFRNGDFIRPVLCLAAAGLLLGLVGTLRLSPVGAVATGLAYTVSYLALLVNPDAMLNFLPGRVSLAGREADLATPLRTGSAMVLGAALLVAVASIGRWRRWPAAEPDADGFAGSATPLRLPDDRPLGADGLGLSMAPLSGETEPGGPPLRERYIGEPVGGTQQLRGGERYLDEPVAGGQPLRGGQLVPGEPDWSVPVTPGWSNERAGGPPSATQRQGHWEELTRDSGAAARRWPTVR
jgi:hypothetical protein